jgi:hypothetical protein
VLVPRPGRSLRDVGQPDERDRRHVPAVDCAASPPVTSAALHRRGSFAS